MAKAAVSEREAFAGSPSARPFECSWEDCPKSFNRKSDLQRHYRIHTNERPYYCTHAGCSKTFIQRSALTVHNRTHTGEKPHRCKHEGCGKKFSDSSSLARHRRIHSGERNYICEVPDCRKEFCRKTTLTKHAKKHPVEHSCAIDDDADDSADDDWDSDLEDSAHQHSNAQAISRPTSCFGNHWRLPAETVQQTEFGKPPHRLETSLEVVKLERSQSGSPIDHTMADVTEPNAAYSYIPTSNGVNRKPPPVHTQTYHDYRSIPMPRQYSGETAVEAFQSPTSLGSPDSYAQFSPQPGSIHSQTMYLHQSRYNTYPQPPRVHDVRLDDPLQVSQQQVTDISPSINSFPNSVEPLSAHDSQFSMDRTNSEDQLQNYLSPAPVPQAQYHEPQANLIQNLRFNMPITTYVGNYDWYKTEEDYPGYALPSDRVQGL